MPIHIGNIIGLTRLFSDSGVSGPCLTGLLSDYSTTWVNDSVLLDNQATGTHDAIKGVSVYLDGGSYSTLATPIVHVGDFKHTFSFRWDGAASHSAFWAGDNTVEGMLVISNTTSTVYLYIAGAIDYFSGITIIPDTTYNDCTLERVGDQATLIVGGVSDTVTVSTANVTIRRIGYWPGAASTLFEGYLWDYIFENPISTEVFNNYLATGAGTVSPGTVGPDITWSGLTPATDWAYDARWGHDWNGTDGYVIADGLGTYAVNSILPASYTSEGTLYTGSARNPLAVFGHMADLDSSEELTLAHLVGSETVTSSTGTSTVSVAAGKLTFTAGTVGYALLSDGTELIFQAAFDSSQIIIYDVRASGTRHPGTFTGATVGVGGQWSTANTDESWLGQYGGRVSGVNIIPGTTAGLAADGNALTFTNPWDNLPADTLIFNYAEAPAIFELDTTRQLLDINGDAIDVDPTDIVDTDLIITGTKGQALLTEAQTGACLAQTEAYVGK